ncbi:MAG: glycosyltransferase family 39 protein [Candidatus Altiarchaeota archaeon]|nr:glycosyltransferase family 39 protein [Candidatus Altiarchaeota archaeon]
MKKPKRRTHPPTTKKSTEPNRSNVQKKSPPIQRKSPNKICLLLIGILIFSIIVRLYYFIGLHFSDAPSYVGYAQSVLDGTYKVKGDYPPHNRLFFIFPIALSIKLFGFSEWSVVLFTFICSVTAVLTTFFLGKLLFNPETGLLASFLLAVYPIDVLYSTQVMTEVPLSCFMALSVFFFLKYARGYTRPIYLVLCGVFVGISYMIREIALILGIYFLIYILKDLIKSRKIKYCYLYLFIGFCIVFLIEYLIYDYLSGDGFFRLKSLVRYFGKSNANYGRSGSEDVFSFYPLILLNQLAKPFYYGYSCWLVILSLAYFLLKKDENIHFVAVWLAAVYLYLDAGSMSLTEYILMAKRARYLAILTIPAVLIISRFLWIQLTKKNNVSRIFWFLVMMSLIITNLSVLETEVAGFRCGYRGNVVLRECDLKSIAEFLYDKPQKTLYVSDSFNILRVFLKNERYDIRNIDYVNNPKVLKDSYVVVNLTTKTVRDKRYLANLPSWRKDIPKEWILLKKIVNINPDNPTSTTQNYPVIYYVPPD